MNRSLKEEYKDFSNITLYHGDYKTNTLEKNSGSQPFYTTPDFVYAALYSVDDSNQHGCIMVLEPKRDLNIFDARNEDELQLLKSAYEETGNTLKINFERFKDEDWSTVCFRKDSVRDKYILPLVKELGFDGYINYEWDDEISSTYADGLAGVGLLRHHAAIGIFDTDLLTVTDVKEFDDFFEDEKFVECFQADKNYLIDMCEEDAFEDVDDALDWTGLNLPFLDSDTVIDIVESYI